MGVAAAAVVWTSRRADQASTDGVRGSAYRITYRVEQGVSGPATTEVLEVDPGRVSRRLLPSGGAATTESGVYDRTGDGTWRRLAVVAPGEAGHELQLGAPLAWAESAGRAARDGTGEVAGIACTWWLTARPLDVGTFSAATEQDRVRSCVDDAGRLLADEWRGGGRDLLRRTATAVEAIRMVDVFDGGQPSSIDPRLGTTAVETRSAAGEDVVVVTAPPGGALRVAVRLVEVAPGTVEAVRRAERAVFVGGGIVTVVDQIRSAEARQPRGDADVDLGPLGTGRISGTAGGLVIEVPVGGAVVRVRSGLALDALVPWLSRLQVAAPMSS